MEGIRRACDAAPSRVPQDVGVDHRRLHVLVSEQLRLPASGNNGGCGGEQGDFAGGNWVPGLNFPCRVEPPKIASAL